MEGYEYSADGLIWQESNVFDNLDPNTQYTFYQRIAETDTVYASEKSVGVTAWTQKVINVSGVGQEVVTFSCDDYDGMIYIALYDSQNRVVDVFMRKCAESIEVKPREGTAFSEARIFLWSGEHSMIPYCEFEIVR